MGYFVQNLSEFHLQERWEAQVSIVILLHNGFIVFLLYRCFIMYMFSWYFLWEMIWLWRSLEWKCQTLGGLNVMWGYCITYWLILSHLLEPELQGHSLTHIYTQEHLKFMCPMSEAIFGQSLLYYFVYLMYMDFKIWTWKTMHSFLLLEAYPNMVIYYGLVFNGKNKWIVFNCLKSSFIWV